MNIQDEVQKIHHKYGTTEKANYEIQKLFDAELKKMYSEEEIERAFYEGVKSKVTFNEWFNQFKKQNS